jgi:hypothetical protein
MPCYICSPRFPQRQSHNVLIDSTRTPATPWLVIQSACGRKLRLTPPSASLNRSRCGRRTSLFRRLSSVARVQVPSLLFCLTFSSRTWVSFDNFNFRHSTKLRPRTYHHVVASVYMRSTNLGRNSYGHVLDGGDWPFWDLTIPSSGRQLPGFPKCQGFRSFGRWWYVRVEP